MQVVAILALAYPEFQKTVNNAKYSDRIEKLFVPMNILFQLISGLLNTISTWYGPISIIIPINVSSQLLSNMFFFGMLGIEKFPKDVRVGTFIVASGALILPLVGPTAQEGQDVVQLFEHLPAELWTAILVISTAITGYYCVVWIGEKSKNGTVNHDYKDFILMTAKVASGVLSTSLSKFLVGTSGWNFSVTLVGFIGCSLTVSSVSILQATETDQSVFVPISSCGVQLLNAFTGLIIWQDYLVVQSWFGYFTVVMQIVLGVYLISSMDEYSSSVDSNYALAQSVKIQIGKEIAHERGKSIVAYAGGSVETMLAPIIEDEENHDDHISNKIVRFRTSGNTRSIFASKEVTESNRSYVSYESIDSEDKFSQEFG